jgi:hypothetical protein
MKIDITGLPKAQVLLCLYKYANAGGGAYDARTRMAFSMAPRSQCTLEDAEKCINDKKQVILERNKAGILGLSERDAYRFMFNYVVLGDGVPKSLKVDISQSSFDSE